MHTIGRREWWHWGYFRRFVEAEPAEEPQLHHLHFARIQRAETPERFVQRDVIDIRLALHDEALVKRHFFQRFTSARKRRTRSRRRAFRA